MFYAQSWALTHMLFMGEPRRVKELSAFLQLMSGGLDQPEAWRKAFGDLRIDRELQQYVGRFSMKAYQLELPQKIVQFKGTASTTAGAGRPGGARRSPSEAAPAGGCREAADRSSLSRHDASTCERRHGAESRWIGRIRLVRPSV